MRVKPPSVRKSSWRCGRKKCAFRVSAQAADNCIGGQVSGSGYLGDVSIYHVRLRNGPTMKATAANLTRMIERPIGWNDQVWLSWPREAGIVLTQ